MTTTRKTPWYKEKYSRQRYLKYGEPLMYTEENLPYMYGWIPLTKEELEMWEDAKTVVIQKDKKREYMIEVEEETGGSNDGRYMMKVTVLHLERTGFTFTAEDSSIEELQKRFWPTVAKLIALLVNPRLATNPLWMN